MFILGLHEPSSSKIKTSVFLFKLSQTPPSGSTVDWKWTVLNVDIDLDLKI